MRELIKEWKVLITRMSLYDYISNPGSFFDLEFLILFDLVNEERDSEIFHKYLELIDKNFIEECDGTLSSLVRNQRFFFKKSALKRYGAKSLGGVINTLFELETLEWNPIFQGKYLDVYECDGSGIFVCFGDCDNKAAFFQFEDFFVFVAFSYCYTCMMYNGYHREDEYYIKEYCLCPENAINCMKRMCKALI